MLSPELFLGRISYANHSGDAGALDLPLISGIARRAWQWDTRKIVVEMIAPKIEMSCAAGVSSNSRQGAHADKVCAVGSVAEVRPRRGYASWRTTSSTVV